MTKASHYDIILAKIFSQFSCFGRRLNNHKCLFIRHSISHFGYMVMLLHAANLNEFFREVLSDLQCQEDTQAYIIGIFGKYRTATYDLSHYSVGALFAQARSNHSFFDYQSLGDFIFWQSTVNPENFQHASKDYYDTIAQLSYDAC